MTEKERFLFLADSALSEVGISILPPIQRLSMLAKASQEMQKEGVFDNTSEKSSPSPKPRSPLPEISLVHKKEYYGDNVAEVATIIRNRCGVYPGRTASLLTQTANKFNSKIQFKAKGKTLDAKSIIMWTTANLQRGDEITISATGSDAGKAVKALVELIDSKFGEE